MEQATIFFSIYLRRTKCSSWSRRPIFFLNFCKHKEFIEKRSYYTILFIHVKSDIVGILPGIAETIKENWKVKALKNGFIENNDNSPNLFGVSVRFKSQFRLVRIDTVDRHYLDFYSFLLFCSRLWQCGRSTFVFFLIFPLCT